MSGGNEFSGLFPLIFPASVNQAADLCIALAEVGYGLVTAQFDKCIVRTTRGLVAVLTFGRSKVGWKWGGFHVTPTQFLIGESRGR